MQVSSSSPLIGCSSLPCTGRAPLSWESLNLILGRKGQVRVPFLHLSQVPSDQNNQYAKLAYFEVASSDLLQYQNQKADISTIHRAYSNFTCQPKNVLFDKRKNDFPVQDQKLLLSPSFISALIFMISSLIQTLGFFVLLFLVALGVRLGCLFNVFLDS